MFKWIIFLSILSVIDAQYVPGGQCSVPRLAHGRPRWRSRSKLIKYICSPGYELVGSRYATCKNGQWDSPKPTCVRPGCPVPELKNGLVISTRSDAWLVFFCLPGYKLVGSSAMFCDGISWNATVPTCVDSTISTKLSCDFETPDLCGWTQDSLHDFDWERLNQKTPSSFLFTGPSHDHTIGKGGTGYYMYIESSSRKQNETARLISPIFDMKLAKDGCFSFYYHMFGRDIGGLRVYQKPDNIHLQTMIRLPEESRKKYILFEMWGNQGDFWYGDVSQLQDFGDNFQIVIEGIRGKKFTSDIAIDDVAILQGENCEAARKAISPPPALLPETCEGRCRNPLEPPRGCGCTIMCLVNNNCCPDFYDICFDTSDTTTEDPDPSSAELPQTQKLIGKTTTQPSTELESTPKGRLSTQPTTTTVPTTSKITVTTTIKPTTKTVRITKSTTTTKAMNVTVFQKDAISDKAKSTNVTTTRLPKPTTVTLKTTKKTIIYKPSTKALPRNVTAKVIKTTTPKTKTVPLTTTVKTTFVNAPRTTETYTKKTSTLQRPVKSQAKSSAWRPVLITLAVLLCCGGLAWIAAGARGARGRAALAALRGRARNDPEVRYLHSDVDDE
ncbi:hypothetical protein ABMA28_010824 [Loxostege sticticalis]|uniref:Uncharacterized protein n=2 Tax=Loxostege sticticalis TaxID=481309 RepID=A0ABD0S7D7_LOXSC